MFCSTIIPTVGRSSLADAVDSVLSQEGAMDDCEVIVVNDSGRPLPAADWQHAPNVRVLDTQRRERCVARNTGAALARGKYLHFLDDDDVILPGAMAAFWDLDQQSNNVVWLYGSYQTVDNSGAVIATWRPGIMGDIFPLLIAGEGIPFQASLLLNERFHQIGAFDPHPSIIGVEDRDVGRRMALAGHVAYTPEVVARIRIGEETSTTNWSTLAESDRWSREKTLRLLETSRRLRASAHDGYLRGRVTRAYIASSVWNLKRQDLFTAANRATVGVSFCGRYLFSSDYGRGLQTTVK